MADLQNDFAARAHWGVTPRYRDANHHPGSSVREGLDLRVRKGQKVTLHDGTPPLKHYQRVIVTVK
ncbi:hypothetical protein [Paractinoplanes toevensis]|uniref:Uncharacterized protein n=1 Tax=Paractinoplanes toevensis TaxID=571911 RepID=A0A919T8C3_9ACTN|nr:hypothetical protein [Actinoplanes toevensis]GIM90998.1 hypothetical protein Ato02nite_027910 [Actinoplanes toevensis]